MSKETITPTFYGVVHEGKLDINRLDAFKKYLKTLDGLVMVQVQEKKKIRTQSQNNFYWGAVLPTVAEATGHTTLDLHEIFKRKFLPVRTIKFGEREVRLPGSTAILSKMQFSEYIDKIGAEVGTMGIVLPTAEEFTGPM